MQEKGGSLSSRLSSRSDVDGKRNLRNQNLRYALFTAVIARMSGIALQIVSLPIAAFQLGPADFSIYAMLGAILAAMTLSNLGMGQSTTLHMSNALAARDRTTAREMLSLSLTIIGLISLVVSAVMAALIIWSPLMEFAFSQHLQGAQAPKAAALFVCAVFLATQVLSAIEAAQLAQQKQYRLNIAISLGTLVAAGAVWWAATVAPSVLMILVAVHLPVIVSRSLNAFSVITDIWPKIADLRPALSHARSLVADGLRFLSSTSLSNFLCHALSVITVGLFAAPLATASFVALMNAVLLFCSALSLVAIPFRSAMPEAQKHGDHEWMRTAKFRLLAANLAIAFLVCLLFSVFGQWLFSVWYQGSVDPSRLALLGASIYCILLAIEVANFTYLSSIGWLEGSSRWLLLRSLSAAVAVLVAASLGYHELVFWVLALFSFAFSFIPLTVIMIRFGRNAMSSQMNETT